MLTQLGLGTARGSGRVGKFTLVVEKPTSYPASYMIRSSTEIPRYERELHAIIRNRCAIHATSIGAGPCVHCCARRATERARGRASGRDVRQRTWCVPSIPSGRFSVVATVAAERQGQRGADQDRQPTRRGRQVLSLSSAAALIGTISQLD
eukprot:6177269-Pleurochrysis_carterae.AAC.6